MHKKLTAKFVENHQKIEDDKVRNDYGIFTALVGIISNLILFLIKITLGLLINSISILADSLNNLVDSISSIITLVGFKLSAKPADKDHPFGHARYESISGLFVGIIVVYVGFEFIKASISKVFNPTPVQLTTPMLLLLFFTVLIKLWQYSFNNFIGKKIKSNVILATAVDSRNDSLITLLVLLGVIFEYLFKLQVDGYVGLALAIFIIVSGITMLRETVYDLLGRRPSNEKIKAIEDLLSTYTNILGFHDLIIHQYGYNQYFATVHIEVDANLDLLEAHDIINEIENDFLEKLIINMVIHLDPVVLDDPINNAYWKAINKIVKEYDSAYSLHDFRLIKHHNHNVIFFDLVVDQKEDRRDEIILKELKAKINEVYVNDKIEIVIDRNYLSARR
ncbi:MAG: cation diffusion facilitator family transporter [Erysipelothrix sp.]|nr:cation diffusion facilitator family transporter [Erysipelothrix sp.]